jgi:hypothetical protein
MNPRPSGLIPFIPAVLLTIAMFLPGTTSAAKNKEKVKDKDPAQGHAVSIWTHTDDRDNDLAFILVEDGGEVMSGSGDQADYKEAERLGKDSGEDLVWARLEGHTYLITDSSVVRRAREAMAPVKARELRDVRNESQRLSRTMDELGRQQDALSKRQEPLSHQQDELGQQSEKLSRKMNADLKALVRQAVEAGLVIHQN